MDTLDLILTGKRNEPVPAIIRPLNLFNDILSWYGQWFPKMYDISGQPLYGDSHWDVPRKFEFYNKENDFKVLILDAMHKIQGYTIINLNHIGSDGNKCIYVPFIASAPWNRKSIYFPKREFKDIGKILIAVSILWGKTFIDTLTLELHSLSEVEDFYRHLGMRETGRIEKDLKEFRIENDKAYNLLRFLLPHLKLGSRNE